MDPLTSRLWKKSAITTRSLFVTRIRRFICTHIPNTTPCVTMMVVSAAKVFNQPKAKKSPSHSRTGQQVTGYGHADDNNFWQIIPTKALPETGRGRIVRHDDTIQLLHVSTQSYLLTHDVASPLMPTNQEFTSWPRDDRSRYNDTLFHLYLIGGYDSEAVRSKSGHFKLVHVPTKVSLWTHRDQLPDWAFKQQEVNGDRNPVEKTATWYMDDIISSEGEGPSRICCDPSLIICS